MENNNLQQNILEKIKAGEISMRSKKYFMAHLILLIVLAVLVLLTSSFLISFILFSIHVSGRFFLLGFGWRGFIVFFMTFPWLMLFVDAIFIGLLELLLKRFKFGYRAPLVYTLGGVVVVTLLAGIVINQTPLHNKIYRLDQRGPLPVIGSFYTRIQRPPHESGVFRGTVISMASNTFMIANPDQDGDATTTQILLIILDPRVDASTIVATSDTVFVAGDINGNTIRAFGIRKLLPEDQI